MPLFLYLSIANFLNSCLISSAVEYFSENSSNFGSLYQPPELSIFEPIYSVQPEVVETFPSIILFKVNIPNDLMHTKLTVISRILTI